MPIYYGKFKAISNNLKKTLIASISALLNLLDIFNAIKKCQINNIKKCLNKKLAMTGCKLCINTNWVYNIIIDLIIILYIIIENYRQQKKGSRLYLEPFS